MFNTAVRLWYFLTMWVSRQGSINIVGYLRPFVQDPRSAGGPTFFRPVNNWTTIRKPIMILIQVQVQGRTNQALTLVFEPSEDIPDSV